mmetsp:Transcript_99109/g.275971  ORF Transcript_99109/g.275971 Transcript_99109/m.275971 type:complete len:213 (-) Transcript_99109:465-1103(-)
MVCRVRLTVRPLNSRLLDLRQRKQRNRSLAARVVPEVGKVQAVSYPQHVQNQRMVLCPQEFLHRDPAAIAHLLRVDVQGPGLGLQPAHDVEVGLAPLQSVPVPERQDGAEPALHARLLKHLPARGLAKGLSRVEQAARHLPIPLPRPLLLHDKQLVVGSKHEAGHSHLVGREGRHLVLQLWPEPALQHDALAVPMVHREAQLGGHGHERGQP